MRDGLLAIACACACVMMPALMPTAARAQPKKPASASAAPPPPSAPPGPKPLSQALAGDAKADYDAGKLLIGDGDFVGAEVKFRSAYDRSSDPRLLWNIAACEKNQRHYARTLTLLRQYMADGGALLTDADRAEAKALVDTIESLTVNLTITVSEAGASVTVDDETVGTSPLPGPLVVDIGSRKIVVKKTGFKDFSQTVPIGGSAEAHVEVALLAEVHEGKLSVTTLAGAAIFIDGQRVGVGHFEDELKSGGHTLRVEAAGMHPYQSEVTIADDENRSVDVPLEKEYVPPPPEDKGPGFEVGLQYGPGVKLHGDQPLEQMVRVDVGWRPGWSTNLGLYLEFGDIAASGVCGTSMHGPSPSTPTDLDLRYSFQSCTYAKAGFQIAVHLLPAHRFDPWLAFEPGFRLTFFQYRHFDPLGEQQDVSNDGGPTPALDLGLRVGLDWHPVASYRPWAIGPYASVVVTPLANENPANNNNGNNNGGNNDLQPGNNDNGNNGPASYVSLFFGLRTSLAF
jgi:PEGA domain